MAPPTDVEAPPRRRPFAGPAPRRAEGHDEPPAPRAPIDPRFRARRIEVRRDAGRRRLYRLGVLGVLVVVLLVLAGLAFTPLFDVDRLEVEGTFRTDPQDVLEAGDIHRGDPTVLVDASAATAAVAALPWVADVHVERSFPGTVRYVVVEREPAAAALTDGGRGVVLDGEGQVVQVVEGDPAALDLPLLDGVVAPAEQGATIDRDDRTELLLEVARALPGGLVPVVGEVRTGDAGVELGLVPTGTALLGEADDLEGAYVALASVLGAVTPACVGTVDVAVPAAPVLTAVPGCQ
jgi:cell division protein FtsQ